MGGVEVVRNAFLDAFEKVSVAPEGRELVSMAEAFLNGERAGTHLDELTRMGVAEVVGAEVVWQADMFDRGADDMVAQKLSVERLTCHADEDVIVG